MAPGSVASSDSSTSSTSLASSVSTISTSEWSGTEKPGPNHRGIPARRHPPVLRMVLEALQAGEQRRGTSVVAIKVYILQKYPMVDAIRLKYLLKRALDTGMQRGLLVRPTNSKAKGATGSFKLVPKYKKGVQPRKMATVTVPGRPVEAKAQVPKKGDQTKDKEARVGKAKKAPRQPDNATNAPPGASGPHGKSKVKSRRSSPDAKAHRKTKAGSQSSKPTVTKGKNRVASPAKKKMENKAPKEAAAQGAREGPKAKAAAAPPKGNGSKTVPVALTRKTEVPKGAKKPAMPTKTSSFKGPKKAEAKS